MPKTLQSPGTALTSLMEKHGLNPNRLAKAIGMSTAMVRLISRDETPVSISSALRLAKFFKNKPEFWLDLQNVYLLAIAEKDKELAKELKGIPEVGKYHFVRKPHKPGAGRPSGKAKTKKTAKVKKTKSAQNSAAGA